MKKSFVLQAKVWRWPGDGGWYFVNVDKEISKNIRARHPKGFVYITAQINKTKWDTALFPHKISESYLLSIHKKVRKAEDIFEGDIVKIKVSLK